MWGLLYSAILAFTMMTLEQETWLTELNDIDSVEIFPYNTETKEKFIRIKRLLHSILGQDTVVEHRGSTSFEISGQGELDIFIPIATEFFDSMIIPLEQVFGKPQSHYFLDCLCFIATVDTIKVKIFVITDNSKSWSNIHIFEEYVREYPEALNAYRIFKGEGHSLSTQAYHRKKLEFINAVLDKMVTT